MRAVNENVAKRFFSDLLAAVERGENVTIMRRGVPIAVLTPTSETKQKIAARAIERWLAYREEHNITLGPDLTIRQLIDEGRKY